MSNRSNTNHGMRPFSTLPDVPLEFGAGWAIGSTLDSRCVYELHGAKIENYQFESRIGRDRPRR